VRGAERDPDGVRRVREAIAVGDKAALAAAARGDLAGAVVRADAQAFFRRTAVASPATPDPRAQAMATLLAAEQAAESARPPWAPPGA
jgi:hypothetical protein